MLNRLHILAAIAVLSLVLFANESVQSQGVPPVGPSSAVVWVSSININPSAPPVGTNYYVTVHVRSRHHRSLLVRAGIRPPSGYVVRSNAPDQVIGPGGSASYTFTVYCGVDGGTVYAKADPIRELR